MAPESEEKSVETDEFIYPDQILEVMEYSLQECQECQSRNIENLNLGWLIFLINYSCHIFSDTFNVKR